LTSQTFDSPSAQAWKHIWKAIRGIERYSTLLRKSQKLFGMDGETRSNNSHKMVKNPRVERGKPPDLGSYVHTFRKNRQNFVNIADCRFHLLSALCIRNLRIRNLYIRNPSLIETKKNFCKQVPLLETSLIETKSTPEFC